MNSWRNFRSLLIPPIANRNTTNAMAMRMMISVFIVFLSELLNHGWTGIQNRSCLRIRVVCGGEIGSPRQETTRQQRELRVSESHKAAFELRIAAQILCRKLLVGFLPVSSQWSWFS